METFNACRVQKAFHIFKKPFFLLDPPSSLKPLLDNKILDVRKAFMDEFDAIVRLEETWHREGMQEGVVEGRVQGKEQGYLLG